MLPAYGIGSSTKKNMHNESTYTKEQEAYWNSSTQKERRHPEHPIVRTYVEPKVAYVQQQIDVTSVQSILDVGAGNGYFSFYLNKWAPTTAVDYSPVILENNPVADKKVMDARHLDCADNSYDLVFCHAVLHHIDTKDQVQVIREMGRVAKKYVVIIEPNRNNPLMAAFGALKKEEHGLLRFSRGYVQHLVEQAGLTVAHSKTYGLLTPNRMPIPMSLLPLLQKTVERPLPFGMVHITIAAL